MRQKVFTIVNIFGLAVAMAISLVIFQLVVFELSFDDFHEKKKEIYRVVLNDFRNNVPLDSGIFTGFALGEIAKTVIPEIKDVVRVFEQKEGFVLKNSEINEPYQEDGIWFADPTFFKVFDFQFLYGNKNLALSTAKSVVLNKEMALKYFGKSDILGKSIIVSGGWASGEYIVSGILKEIPKNSHMQFDILFPMSVKLEMNMYKASTGWYWHDFVTYIHLKENSSLAQVQSKLDAIVLDNIGEDLKNSDISERTTLQKLEEIHLNPFQEDIAVYSSNKNQLRYYSIIAFLILAIAYINYINLSTSQSLARANEVGIRKTIGASRMQLVFQFMGESLLVNFFAAGLSLILVQLFLPLLNDVIGIEIELSVFKSLKFWIGYIFIISLGAFLSGYYPSFLLSSFSPAKVLKSASMQFAGGFDLRKLLIVFQLGISLVLISGSWLIFNQIKYMQNKSTGIDMNKILVVNGPRVIIDSERAVMENQYSLFKSQVVNHHAIHAVTGAGRIPGLGYDWSSGVRRADDRSGSENKVNIIQADRMFFETYNLKFLAGAGYSSSAGDMEEAVLTESTIKYLGFTSVNGAVGEILQISGDYRIKIVGVVEDFKWNSFKEESNPLMFVGDELYNAFFSVRLDLKDLEASLQHIENAYKTSFPDDPFYYYFLDEQFNNQYHSDKKFLNLFTGFACFAIFIACLGLFAMVSYTATLRTKEIGIRKILGAQVSSIMLLLSKEYLMLFLIASILAAPIFILLATNWLTNYAFRIEISSAMILVPISMLFLITVVTISVQTFKTALINPVDSLKDE